MPYSVELLFDEETENKIYGIWDELYNKGLSEYMKVSGSKPHITLAIYKTVDYPTFESRVEHFFKGSEPFKVNFCSIGVFPGESTTVFYQPVVDDNLISVNRNFFNAFRDYDDKAWDYYKPGNWIPHMTMSLGTDFEKGMDIIRLLGASFTSFEATVEGVVIVKFRPVHHMLQIDLKQVEGGYNENTCDCF
ncbi:MAG: 2'-5' RNA ligase family protein [Xylanivirga thermophila]|uniref:2'-5' RNA ligase family protein n=1 Tax=Xylanivirga thermophila TaxID=2496273 RepID=UPI0039F44E0E